MAAHLQRVGAALVCLLVIACGTDTSPGTAAPRAPVEDGPPAALASLIGPWRPEPLPLPQPLVAAADRVCRADSAFPPAVSLVLVDARGGGKLMAYYAGPGASAECAYLEIGPTGGITGSISSTSNGLQPGVAPGRLEVMGGGGSSDDDGMVWQAVSGRAGAGIERVVFDVADIGPVTAALRNGWFGAWWPVGEPLRPMNGPGPHVPSKSYVVTAYDALGQPIDTYASP